MTVPLTYLDFLLLAVVAPILLLAVLTRHHLPTRFRTATAIVTFVGLVYTTPWDNALVARGVWWYGEGAVLARLAYAPVEEYLFIILQPALVALWLAWCWARLGDDATPTATSTDNWATATWRRRLLGVVAGLAVSVVGLALLAGTKTLYIGAILAWAGPVLAIQWGFGWWVLWQGRRLTALAISVPTAYLGAVDRVAIELGIWTLSPVYTTGVTVLGLPIEEGAFFLVTCVFVVQGLVLFEWVVDDLPAGATSDAEPDDEVTPATWARSDGSAVESRIASSAHPDSSSPDSRLLRLSSRPVWLVLLVVAGTVVLAGRPPVEVGFLVLLLGTLVVGLPHGAVDHLFVGRLLRTTGDGHGDDAHTNRRGRLAVGGVYLFLGGAYLAVWFAAPVVAFVGFLLLTCLHWGLADLYTLLATDGTHLRTRPQRLLAAGVRGAIPMVVPLVAFPDEYRTVAALVVDAVGVSSVALLSPVFSPAVRSGLGWMLLLAAGLHLGVGLRRSPGDWSWATDAGETVLLLGFFAVVPPVLAIGCYFACWHALRHVLRVGVVDGARPAAPARLRTVLTRFGRDALPLTIVSLVGFAGLVAIAPSTPTEAGGVVGLTLVLIAVLTLPHTVVVAWADRRQGVWAR